MAKKYYKVLIVPKPDADAWRIQEGPRELLKAETKGIAHICAEELKRLYELNYKIIVVQ